MAMIKIIEDYIIKKLKEEFSEYEVDGFPVNFERYTITSPVGAMLLKYEKHTNSVQKTNWAVTTEKTYKFTLYEGIRYLKKHTEAYNDISKTERVLNGLTILNKRLSVTECNFVKSLSGDLWYSFSIAITLPLTDEYKDLSIANQIITDIV